VLEAALNVGDPKARGRARDVINRLTTRGFHGLTDLLGE
jgi:hypothetical protein